jgi:hypothetical protein
MGAETNQKSKTKNQISAGKNYSGNCDGVNLKKTGWWASQGTWYPPCADKMYDR